MYSSLPVDRFRHSAGYDAGTFRNIREYTRRYLANHSSGEIENRNGKFFGTEMAVGVIAQAGVIVRRISENSDYIRLPFIAEEQKAFGSLLAHQMLPGAKPLRLIAPVCPDYGEGDLFHSQIGVGISHEAQAAISGVPRIHEILTDAGIEVDSMILVADTEFDSPDIIQRCADGDTEKYLANCQLSKNVIQKKIPQIQVSTFTEQFGTTFHEAQHSYEALMKDFYAADEKFFAEVEKTSASRSMRHSQILGRQEEAGELAIRYMAQYAALGTLGRELDQQVLFVNYETPNRAYYNAATYKGIALAESDSRVVPVLGTVIKR